jgi:hypothetical protein
MHSAKIKKKVFALRKAGYSYSDIQKRTDISQATLSDWLSNVPYTPNAFVRGKIKNAHKAAIEAAHKRVAADDAAAHRDACAMLGAISARDVLMLGLGLYLGEGDKGGKSVAISNSDPDTLVLALRWLLTFPGITKSNIWVRVHTYPDLDAAKVLNFWSKKLGIPKNQFGAFVVDRRVKKMRPRPRKLFFGTAHLIIRARGNRKHGVYLARVIRELLKRVAQA